MLTCPFDAVAVRLPTKGTLLDVGCGSGLFAHLAAARGLHVTGYDPDPRKVALTRASIQPGELIDVQEGTLDAAAVTGRRFDAIVFLDVLYLVPPEEQARLMRRAAGLLTQGGRLLIKTMHDESPLRSALDGVQETVATGV
ncbi:MAG TPA: class I SAM-dependent methyltransferase, partial [Rhodothermales bacterium]|nr:class I SAM-dependent methyltransferase [Rhodothermales bacterium]